VHFVGLFFSSILLSYLFYAVSWIVYILNSHSTQNELLANSV